MAWLVFKLKAQQHVVESPVIALHSLLLFYCLFDQSEKSNKKGEDLDADDENVEEEDSQFMKLAKKLTAKTLQRKGQRDKRPHKNKACNFPNSPRIFLSNHNKQVAETCLSV